MKKYLKSIVVICLMMFSANLMMAQEAKVKKVLTPEEQSQKHVERLKMQLSLSDDQVTAVKALMLERNNKMVELRKNTPSDKVAMRSAGKEVRENYENGLLKILSPEQKEKYSQIRENKKELRAKGKIENK